MFEAVHRQIDFLIVGQGLAGTALAWELLWRGRSVLVIDREDAESSSRIAAGLMTPVTGRRFVRSHRWNEDREIAEKVYRRVEQTLGTPVFRTETMIRLFASHDERDVFEQKADSNHPSIELLTEREFEGSSLIAPWGGFEMRDAARLRVLEYLDRSREYFRTRGIYESASLEESHINPKEPILLEDVNVRAERVIFCQGFGASKNRWFSEVSFDATKGEILTVRIPEWNESRVVHRGIWIAPEEDDLFRVGATHQRESLDATPTAQGRAELLDKLNNFLPHACEVIAHQAAVRPILQGRQPTMGMHPEFSRLGFFNGLGSKGSLLAPQLANHFAGFLNHEHDLSTEYDLNCRWRPSS